MEGPIFALDIGTRTVIGIVGRKESDTFFIEAVQVMEHQTRSMLDGQIHHINQVTEVVKKIKNALEEKTGHTLEKVAVAAAGRALKTVKHLYRKEINNTQQITKEDVMCLEVEAVTQAQQHLAKQGQLGEGINSYHCVGYTAINYYLEDNLIGDLVGQYGKSMGVHIIGTFLPRVVVDSLYTVLQNAGLEMASMTLEPIAAANVIIPETMRQLNIALVDIGAGTSDIAISKDGAINSYAMVPVAGDELTEALCNHYLLDFHEGERVKRLLATEESIILENILGEQAILSSKEILESLANVVEELAKKIANEMLALNEKPPQAVFCIGGGSQFPSLAEKIASNLGLPPQRAAIKGKEVIIKLPGDTAGLIGPEAITPLGIAYTANEQIGLMKAEVNGRMVSFLNTSKPTVADAILAADLNLLQYHGKPGLSITAEVNGAIKIVKGKIGSTPIIKINGVDCDVNTQLNQFCKITVEHGQAGQNAKAQVKDVLGSIPRVKVQHGGELVELSEKVYASDREINLDDWLVDGVKISYNKLETVADVIKKLGYNISDFMPNQIVYTLNGKQQRYQLVNKAVYINNWPVPLDHKVKDLDKLEIIANEMKKKCIKDVISGESKCATKLLVNGQEISIASEPIVKKNGTKTALSTEINSGDVITWEPVPRQMIMADLLNYLNYSTPPQPNLRLVMLVNDTPAAFTSVLNNGDKIVLDWQEHLL